MNAQQILGLARLAAVTFDSTPENVGVMNVTDEEGRKTGSLISVHVNAPEEILQLVSVLQMMISKFVQQENKPPFQRVIHPQSSTPSEIEAPIEGELQPLQESPLLPE